jgi:hypothetical protein
MSGLAQTLAVLALLSAPPPPASSAATRPIPFAYDDTRLWVEVTFPGHAGPPASFVLDSGVSGTLLDEGLARRLGLEVTPEGETTGAGGGHTRIGRTGPLRLSVGGVPLEVERARVAPLESLLTAVSGRHVEGIIGAPFFLAHVVSLDFTTQRMTLHDPESFQPRAAGSVIPVELIDGTPLARGALTLPDGRIQPLRVLLDLGAKATLLLSEPFIERAHLREAFPKAMVAPLGAGMGGRTRYAFARAQGIFAGADKSTALAGPMVGLSVNGVLGSHWYDGLLGAGYLSRFNVTFDYARRRVILEPTPRLHDPDRFDTSGLFLEARGPKLDALTVAEIRPHSRAEAAGLQPGDVITRAFGEPASRFTLGQLRARLSAATGTKITLKLRRKGHERTVELRP